MEKQLNEVFKMGTKVMTLMTLQIRLIQFERIGFLLLICPSTLCLHFNIELD